MSQKLTPRRVDTMASNMVETISREKLAVTLSAIRRLRARGKFPKENDEYEAFLGKSASTNTRNAAGLLQQKTKPVFVQDVFNNAQRFKKPEVFFNTVRKYPKYYLQPWGFRPFNVAKVEDMVKALQYAYNETQRLQARYVGPFKSPEYLNSMMTILRHRDGTNQIVASGYGVEARQLKQGSELMLINFNSWAAAIEALSVEKYRDVGILYQAAKVTARKFPGLDISYTYTNMNSRRYLNLALPLTHEYMIPVIRISMRGGNKASQRFSKPGRNMRSGTSPFASTRQKAAKQRREDRKAARRQQRAAQQRRR